MSRLPALWRGPVFLAWFVLEVVRSSGRVLFDIATPGSQATPRVVRMETRSRSDAELTLIAALITLTPGTLTVGTRTHGDQRILLVHSMYHASSEDALTDLHDMEDRMLHGLGAQRSGVER